MVMVTSIHKTVDLHELAGLGKKVDYLEISPEDSKRRRFRAQTLGGLGINISLDRNAELTEGAVLHETEDYLVLLRIKSASRLVLAPYTTFAGMQIGFLAGHLHWKARIDENAIHIEIETDVADYQARLDDYLDREDYSANLESDELNEQS